MGIKLLFLTDLCIYSVIKHKQIIIFLHVTTCPAGLLFYLK